MRASRLQQLGIPPGDAMRAAYRGLASAAKAGASADELEERVRQIVAAPLEPAANPDFGPVRIWRSSPSAQAGDPAARWRSTIAALRQACTPAYRRNCRVWPGSTSLLRRGGFVPRLVKVAPRRETEA